MPLSSESEFSFVMPFDNTGFNTSCIALANPGSNTVTSLEFISNDNELIDIDTRRFIGGEEQQSFCLPGEYPETAGQRGILKVIGSHFNLSALGFRFKSDGAFATMFPMTFERPADQEATCYDMVQNTVPWNQSGSSSWGVSNAQRLCSGTTDPEATIACFSSGIAEHDDWRLAITECTHVAPSTLEQRCFDLVQGRVPYNLSGSTNWNSSNIDLLCGGTPNPLATIACFSRGIDDGDLWPAAIDACAAP